MGCMCHYLIGHWQPRVRMFLYKQDRSGYWVSCTRFPWPELHNYESSGFACLPCTAGSGTVAAPTSATKPISQPCGGFPFSFSYMWMHVCMYVDVCKCMHIYVRSWGEVILSHSSALLITFKAGSVSQTHRSLAMTISRANFLWDLHPHSPHRARLELQVAATAILHVSGFWGSTLWLCTKCSTPEPSPQSLVLS